MRHPSARDGYDIVVVGAGIVGMAHALAAARAGASVAIVESAGRALGASVRNFGFVTVTGQERLEMWSLARRSREVWAQVAAQAGVRIDQTGLIVTARREEAAAVLEAFLQTEMGEDCVLRSGAELRRDAPAGWFASAQAALISPHELRVEARDAIPALLAWLSERWAVDVLPVSIALDIQPGAVRTVQGEVRGSRIFVCPGDGVIGLYPDLAREMGVAPCKLQMLRLETPGGRLPSPVMSDLGLARYEGYAALPEARALKARLAREQAEHLAAGVHLIAVQSADGSMVVGDSHEYGPSPDPFLRAGVEALILDEYAAVLGAPPAVIERWSGVYAWSPDRNWFSREVAAGVHVTVVTCGAGMSTAFAIGEDVVAGALQSPIKGLI